MTEQDRKLAEAGKYLNKAEGFGEYSLNDDRVRIGRQRLIMLMKEFAIDYHQAKMKEVTDEDIEMWANSKEKIIEEMPETLKLHITKKIECRIEGAKAMRDEIIKRNK